MSKRKLFRTLVCAAGLMLVGLFIAACGGDSDSTSAAADSEGASAAETTDQVTLVGPAPETMALPSISIALERFFPELGLDVELVGTNGNSFVIQQLASGGEDYGVAGAPELMAAASKGEDLTSVASLDQNVFTVVAPEESEINSIDELDSGVLGITNRGGGEVPLAEAVLKGSDLSGSVELRVVGDAGPTVANALKNGTIDAFATGFNDVAVLEAGAANLSLKQILPDEFKDLPSNQLIVRSGLLEDEAGQDVAIRLAQGLRLAYEFALENPDEAYEIVCKRVPSDCTDEAASKALFEAAMGTQELPAGMEWGFHDYEKLQVVQEAVADVAPDADIDLEQLFPNTYIDQINSDPDVK